MVRRPMFAALTAAWPLVAAILGGVSARGDEVRYYNQNGVTWCETRRIVQERVPESHMEERTETVYREEFTTEMRPTTRTVWVPVTEYRWEPFWVGRWNPLVQPYLAYRYVPTTRWAMRAETVNVPVNARRLVPETRTVRRPVGGFRVVEREVVSRVPVGGSPVPAGGTLVGLPGPPGGPPSVPQRLEIGGVHRLESDPPRYGVSTAWRASSNSLR